MEWLVKRAQRGDADAFVALIESCKISMYRVAKGYFAREEDVADAMGDTVLDAFEHIRQLRQPKHFKTWLIRILINHCNRMVRQKKRVSAVEAIPDVGYSPNGFADVEFREMLSSFPEDCQTIALLYYGEGMTYREIADILDMNENTVRSKLARTRKKLERCV